MDKQELLIKYKYNLSSEGSDSAIYLKKVPHEFVLVLFTLGLINFISEPRYFSFELLKKKIDENEKHILRFNNKVSRLTKMQFMLILKDVFDCSNDQAWKIMNKSEVTLSSDFKFEFVKHHMLKHGFTIL